MLWTLLLVSCVFAFDSQWSATFTMTSSASSGGYSTGTVKWRWQDSNPTVLSRYMLELKYDKVNTTNKGTELWNYNGNGGYNTTDTQYKFSDEGACTPTCSTTGIPATQSAMPPMDPTLPSAYFTTVPANNQQCQTFVPAYPGVVKSFSAQRSSTGALTRVCSFILNDGCIDKTYVLTNFVAGAVTIAQPAGCTCNQAIDIEILVDRSSSIDDSEMTVFRTFLRNFVNTLNIGPSAVCVAMTWFHSTAGVQFGPTGPICDKTAILNALSDAAWPIPCPNGGTANKACLGGTQYTCTATGVAYAARNLFDPSQVRAVPKLFLTMTDGAMNSKPTYDSSGNFINPQLTPSYVSGCNTGTCNFLTNADNCTTDLRKAMTFLDNKYNTWKAAVCPTGSCPLTKVCMGIGTACRNDPNFCLSPQHLDILAGGAGVWPYTNPNVLQASGFTADAMNAILQPLLAKTCPLTGSLTCACQSSCAGHCTGCNTCEPPTGCTDPGNLCQTVSLSGGSCVTTPVNPCAAQNCSTVSCNKDGNSGAGACVYAASPCVDPQGCATAQCNPSTNGCVNNYTACGICPWSSWSACSGAVSCGANGTITRTRTPGSDYCTDAGATESASCCAPCDCTVSTWSPWNVTCPDPCSALNTTVQGRTRTLTPATCGGACPTAIANASLIEEAVCNCVVVNCVYEWNAWSTCDCSTNSSSRDITVLTSPRNGGTACPGPQSATCSCCADQWTSTACSCDLFTYTRTWTLLVDATGPGSTPCPAAPNPTIVTVACDPGAGCSPICVSDADCNDNNACTIDNCTLTPPNQAKHCVNTPITCNDNNVCTTDTCDTVSGCQYTTSVVCNDNSVCTDDACDAVLGCVYTPSALSNSCTAINDCGVAACDPLSGCNNLPRDCPRSNNCTNPACDPNWTLDGRTQPCYEVDICAGSIAVIVGVSTAAAIGIAVGLGFLCFMLLGGGTYAIAHQVRADDDVALHKNPLYQGSGKSGTSALHMSA